MKVLISDFRVQASCHAHEQRLGSGGSTLTAKDGVPGPAVRVRGSQREVDFVSETLHGAVCGVTYVIQV